MRAATGSRMESDEVMRQIETTSTLAVRCWIAWPVVSRIPCGIVAKQHSADQLGVSGPKFFPRRRGDPRPAATTSSKLHCLFFLVVLVMSASPSQDRVALEGRNPQIACRMQLCKRKLTSDVIMTKNS